MMGHPYGQGWRAIMAAERKRRMRRLVLSGVAGLGAVAGTAWGVVVSWPW
jgi:hypothetical protein